MNNVLLMIGALLVGILSALVAVPLIVDWNSYRGVFEEEASRMLGRDVRVGGKVAVRFLPAPFVRFEKVRIADTGATGGDPLFRADGLTMRLSLGALLRGGLEADEVELRRPVLRLAVDQDGRGNWTTLSISPGSLPLMPANVSLRSVDIVGGRVNLVSASGRQMATIDGIDGELAADAAEGPYRFKGTALWQGEPREVRFATGARAADATLALRASVRVPANGNTYTLDGRIDDLAGKPRLSGELTAKLPVAGPVAGAGTVGAGSGDGADKPRPRRTEDVVGANYDLKAKVEADANGGRLTDLQLSLDDVADPQLVTGAVASTWGEMPTFEMQLASRSLNLDRFAAAGPASDPLDTARSALGIVLGALPADAETNARLRAERLVLAGEPVTGVRIAMRRSAGKLELTDLQALLPGSTRLEANGIVGIDKRMLAFSGPIRVRGANMGRFVGWARGAAATGTASGAAAPAARYDGPFSVSGTLGMTSGAIELKDATADFGDAPVTGSLRVSSEGRRRITLALDGSRIDLAQLWPGGLDLERLKTILGPQVSTGAAGEKTAAAAEPAAPGRRRPGSGAWTGFYALDPDTADLLLEVRAGEIRVGNGVELRDVDAALAVERGRLAIERLSFVAPSGLAVEVSGDLTGLKEATAPVLPVIATPGDTKATPQRRGSFRWVVAAPTPAAAADAFNAIGWPAALRPSDAALARLGPVRLAGSTEFGSRGELALDVVYDGTVDGGRVAGSARFEDGLSAWPQGPVVAQATIDTGHAERWLDLVGLGAGNARSGAAGLGRGTITVAVDGRPAAGMTAHASVATAGVRADYHGGVALPAGAAPRIDGVLSVDAQDAGDVLAAFAAVPRSSVAAGPTGVRVAGPMVVAAADGVAIVETTGLTVGRSTLSGRARLGFPRATGNDPTERTVDATLVADRLDLEGLAQILSDGRRTGSTEAKAEGAETWPAEPVTFRAVDGLTGRIELSAKRLVLDRDTGLDGVTATVILAPGRVVIEPLTGATAGGRVLGMIAIERIAGGAKATVDAKFDGLELARLRPGVAVPVSITAKLEGQGISLRGIVSALRGRGEVVLGSGRIAGVAPSAIAAVADAAMDAKEALLPEEIRTMVTDGLKASSLEVKPRKLSVLVADGVGRLQSPLFEDAGGQAKLDLAVDLAAKTFTSDWRIEARAKPLPSGKVKAPYPPVVVSAGGLIAAVEEIEVKWSSADFEQELGLRKIERDADELMRLRKLAEEQRAKADAEAAAREAALKREAEEAEAAARAARAAAEARNAQPSVPGAAVGPPAGPGSTTTTPGPGVGTVVAPNDGAAATTPVGPPAGLTAAPTARSPASASTRRRPDDTFPRPFQIP
jgi:uncharacterized protein involved in outer membrane biogenesis